MVTFKNVKSGTYYLALRAWNRTSENKRRYSVFVQRQIK